MPTYDSATRARLADLLHALSAFAADASRDVERDSLSRVMERLRPDEPAIAGAGKDYVALGAALSEVLSTATSLCGQIAGGRLAAQEFERRQDLADRRQAATRRASWAEDGGLLPHALVDRPPPPVREQAAAWREQRGITRHLGDQPPEDRAVEAQAYAGADG